MNGWLKTGIIFLLLSLIVPVCLFATDGKGEVQILCYIPALPGIILYFLPFLPKGDDIFGYYMISILSSISYFIIGAIIGLVYGKIKQRKE